MENYSFERTNKNYEVQNLICITRLSDGDTFVKGDYVQEGEITDIYFASLTGKLVIKVNNLQTELDNLTKLKVSIGKTTDGKDIYHSLQKLSAIADETYVGEITASEFLSSRDCGYMAFLNKLDLDNYMDGNVKIYTKKDIIKMIQSIKDSINNMDMYSKIDGVITICDL